MPLRERAERAGWAAVLVAAILGAPPALPESGRTGPPLSAPARGAAGKGYIGAAACAACHAPQFAGQTASGHARSLGRAHEHPLAASFPSGSPLRRAPGYDFRFLLSSDGMKALVSDRRDALEIPVDWAFGAGEQAVTFVSRISREWYLEHYYSYYAALGAMAPTPGQEALAPKTLPEAPGLMYKTLDPDTGILGCFECHATGPVAVDRDGVIQPFEPGVRCEACHGPGDRHRQAAAAGRTQDARKLIRQPGRSSAAAINQWCGACHRPPGREGLPLDWSYAWNVRHQPPYLIQSACFKRSKGALSCLTCHEPHQPLRKNDPAYYDRKCLACHGSGAARAAPGVCRSRQPADCADCHMPRVAPQPPLRFSNHWIGVYPPGAKLRPLQR